MGYGVENSTSSTCYVCGAFFNNTLERDAHIFVHFEQNICACCRNPLILIASQWYQVHNDANCIPYKQNADGMVPVSYELCVDHGAAEMHRIESIDLPAVKEDYHEEVLTISEQSTAHVKTEVDDAIQQPQSEQYPADLIDPLSGPSTSSDKPSGKRFKCPFCPAIYRHYSTCCKHKYQHHRQEILEMKARGEYPKRRRHRESKDPEPHAFCVSARIQRVQVEEHNELIAPNLPESLAEEDFLEKDGESATASSASTKANDGSTRKLFKCPFCPAVYRHYSTCWKHRHQHHRQAMLEMSERENDPTRNPHVECHDPQSSESCATAEIQSVQVEHSASPERDPSKKSFKCPFCPATFYHGSSWSRHKHKCHRQQIVESKLRGEYFSESSRHISEAEESDGRDEDGECEQIAEEQTEEQDMMHSFELVESAVKVEPLELEPEPAVAANSTVDGDETGKVKSFKCQFCSAAFVHGSSWSRHRHQHHRKQIIAMKLRARYSEADSRDESADKASDERYDDEESEKIGAHRADEQSAMESSGSLGNDAEADTIEEEPEPTASTNLQNETGIKTKCPFCPAEFGHRSSLYKHMVQCHPQSIRRQRQQRRSPLNAVAPGAAYKPFGCPSCPVRFNHASTRHRHRLLFCKNKKDGDVPRRSKQMSYTCPFCSAQFSNVRAWLTHKRRLHAHESVEQMLSQKYGEKHASDEHPVDMEDPGEAQALPELLQPTMAVTASSSTPEPAKTDPLQCPYCLLRFSHNSSYNRHKELCGAVREPDTIIARSCESLAKYSVEMWSCRLCSKQFSLERNAHKHLHISHGSDDRALAKSVVQARFTHVWYCSLCYSSSNNKKSVMNHTRDVHKMPSDGLVKAISDWQDPHDAPLDEGEKPACKYCPDTFDDCYSLNAHKRDRHMDKLDEDRVIKCARCPALFSGHNLHRLHTIKVHGVLERLYQDKFECLVCGESFKLSSVLVAHLREHDPVGSYACCMESCDEHFDTIERLQAHFRKHPLADDNQRKCEKCKKIFTAIGFPNHNCLYQVKICDHCGKQFGSLTLFQQHLNRHTRERIYQCDRCPAKFTCPAGRRRHQLTHTGEKRCKCTVPNCGKAFGQHVDLYRHQFRAHGIFRKKFPCTICEEIFPENSLLRKHMSSHVSF